MMKNCPNAAVPTISMVAFAGASVRRQKIRSGNSGAGERASIPTNAAINAAAVANKPTVAAPSGTGGGRRGTAHVGQEFAEVVEDRRVFDGGRDAPLLAVRHLADRAAQALVGARLRERPDDAGRVWLWEACHAL